jgi:hypothetical protein
MTLFWLLITRQNQCTHHLQANSYEKQFYHLQEKNHYVEEVLQHEDEDLAWTVV